MDTDSIAIESLVSFSCSVLKFCVEFTQLETNACDKGRFVLAPVAVGRCDEGTVGQLFDAGIGIVASCYPSGGHGKGLRVSHDIFIGSAPSDPVAGRGLLWIRARTEMNSRPSASCLIGHFRR